MSEKVKVTLNGITAEVTPGKTLLETAGDMGVGIAHACFGNAICSTCRVNVIEGAEGLSPREMKEKVSLNYHLVFSDDVRLACQAKVVGPNPVVAESCKPFNWLRPRDNKEKIKAVQEGRSLEAND
jgi:ferredoxin